jgi:hypothetical protein
MHKEASGRHALDCSMLPIPLRIGRPPDTLTAPMKAQYVVIGFRCYSSQLTAVIANSSDYGSLCSTVTNHPGNPGCAMAQWSSMPYFHSSMKQPGGVGALHWNGAPFFFSDGRLVVENYPIPCEALDASLHTRGFGERVGGVPQVPQNQQALGGMCFLKCGLPLAVASPLVACTLTVAQFASADTMTTYQTQQLPVRIPPLVLFAEHLYITQAVV